MVLVFLFLGLISFLDNSFSMEMERKPSGDIERSYSLLSTTTSDRVLSNNSTFCQPSFYQPLPTAPVMDDENTSQSDDSLYPVLELPVTQSSFYTYQNWPSSQYGLESLTHTSYESADRSQAIYQNQRDETQLSLLAEFPSVPTNIPTHNPKRQADNDHSFIEQNAQNYLMIPADKFNEMLENMRMLNEKVDALMEAQNEQNVQNEHIVSGQDLIKEQLANIQERYGRLRDDILNPNQTSFQKAMSIAGLTIKLGTSAVTSITSYNMMTSFVATVPAFLAPPTWIPLSVALISGGYLLLKTT